MGNEMSVEQEISKNPERKSAPHWFLLENDTFRLPCVDSEGKEYKHVARIPFGVRVTIEPAKKEKRIRRIKGTNNRFIGRGEITKIEEKGKEVGSLEIDETSINKGEKIEIYLPQQHTVRPEKKRRRKKFPNQGSLSKKVFEKIS